MKCRTVLELDCMCETCRSGGECTAYPDRKVPAGTEIEHPDAFKLVRRGAAEPADEECAEAAGMTEYQMAVAQHAQRRTAAGIHPEDFEAFDAGLMVGYYPDGRHVPGPNATHSEGGLVFDEFDEIGDV